MPFDFPISQLIRIFASLPPDRRGARMGSTYIVIKGENGQASVELPANKEYKYMVMAEGYESMEGSVKLKVESRAHIRVELQPTE